MACRPRGLLLLLLSFLYIICTFASDGFSYSFGRGADGFSSFFGAPASGPVDNQEYYDVLGVSKTADESAIKRAYRKRAVKTHPDKGGDPEVFKTLGEAYQVLSDPQKRQIYDAQGKAGLDGSMPPGGAGGSDMADDILSALFGGRGRSGGFASRAQRKPRAPDATYELEVPLADLYSGATRKIRIWTQKAGVGGGPPVREPKDVDILIEPGMRSGSTVVLRGAQDPGIPGVIAGDLVFVLKESPVDPGGFIRLGDHLVADIELSLTESLMGFARPLPHLDGTTLRVTGGRRSHRWRNGSSNGQSNGASNGLSTDTAKGDATQSTTAAGSSSSNKSGPHKNGEPVTVVKPGDLRRVRGKGMPKRGVPGAFGDLYLRFSVAFPSEEHMASLSDEQRKQLADLLPKAPDFPWKEDSAVPATASNAAAAAAATSPLEHSVELPDPMVVRAIERGGEEREDPSSFMRFFGL